MRTEGRLFRPEMVRGIIARQKIETRRPIACSNTTVDGKRLRAGDPRWDLIDLDQARIYGRYPASREVPHVRARLNGHRVTLRPTVAKGDHMWVRETHRPRYSDAEAQIRKGGSLLDAVQYKADAGYALEPRWTPSILMPRWACRLELVLTAFPFGQRLRYMTPADVEAEGFPIPKRDPGPHAGQSFREYWEALHGEWDPNLLVWVYKFDVYWFASEGPWPG